MKKITTISILIVVIFVTYEEICEYIYNIPKYTTKNGLDHTREMLRRLGNPQCQFQVIHVAGSNGKGSVCAFLHSVLHQANVHVGLFTSPHLIRMEERFMVDGRMCEREEFCDAFEQVRQVVISMEQDGLAHPAFFEYLFAMGMLIFAKREVRYLILETGLGGRLDATNIFDEPLMTIITSISMEHTEILGDTIEKIAWEKAGIIKSGVPVVFDGSNPTVSEVIKKVATERFSPYYQVKPTDFEICRFTEQYTEFTCTTNDHWMNIRIPFVAEYQCMNAMLAYRALRILPPELGLCPGVILRGMELTVWPGRMQEILPGVYLDGAHNTDGIKAFSTTVKRIGGDAPLLLFGMMKEKNYRESVKQLVDEVRWEQIILTKVPDVRGIEPEKLQEEFDKYGISCKVIGDWTEAYRYAMTIKQEQQKLFCAGSLYLIGELERVGGSICD